jgi:hypothetical protein
MTADGREYRFSPFSRRLFFEPHAGPDPTLMLDDVFGTE